MTKMKLILIMMMKPMMEITTLGTRKLTIILLNNPQKNKRPIQFKVHPDLTITIKKNNTN
jgi:hypothetical protein